MLIVKTKGQLIMSTFTKEILFPFLREQVSKHTISNQLDLSYDIETILEKEQSGELSYGVWFVRQYGTNLMLKSDNETANEFNDRVLNNHAMFKDSIVHEYILNFELERIAKVGE